MDGIISPYRIFSILSSELVAKFSSTEPRFEAPFEDPRLFQGTASALKELAAAPPIEFPTDEWTQDQVKDWFRVIGPAFAGVMGGWAGEVSCRNIRMRGKDGY